MTQLIKLTNQEIETLRKSALYMLDHGKITDLETETIISLLGQLKTLQVR